MRNFTKKALLFLVFAILGVTMINAQGGGSIAPQEITKSTTNITLKTFRALFPGQPVAVANEIFGGLHSVADVDSLHGKDGVLNDAELQTGMLIYVASTNMYYRYKGADSNGVNGVTNAVFDVDGVNTNYWESLADVLAAVMGTHVYDDTLGLGADIYEGDVYLAGDTTFVWDGDNWTTMSLTEVDSVYEDRDMFDIPVSGDVAVETDTTYIFDGNEWLVAGVQPSVTMDSIFSIANGDVRTDEGNTIGDIYIAADTTFAWNGDSWETLVLSEVDSVYTDRLAYDSPNSGDVAVETDTTYIFDGNDWLVASVQPAATMDSIFSIANGDMRTDSGNTIGDIYIAADTTFAWNGESWETLVLSEVDSVYTDRLAYDSPNSGDVAIETDTTYIFDGNDWLVASVQPAATMDSIFSIANGDVRTDSGNTIGDIYIAADTTFAWNGDSWETLVLSEVDSVYTDRLAYDSPNSGDVAVETDTTYIFDGNEWLVASVQPSVTMDSVFVGDRTSLTANLVGDIVNDKDSIFVWKGDDWELISVLPSAEVDSFPIFYSLDGTAHFNETVKASDMDDYRSKMVLNDALKQFHGENDVYLYYPAAWGNFTYSIVYGGEKISLTNGIDIETIAATGQVGEVYVHVPYKQVKISSGNQIVEID